VFCQSGLFFLLVSALMDAPADERISTERADPRVRKRLPQSFEPVDVASIAFFRVALGAMLLWEVWRYFTTGWIELIFLRPHFRFTYHGFEWLPLWPASGLYLHFAVLGLLAFLVMVGLWYRMAIVLLWLAFTHVALLDKTQYLNHFYLVSLLSFLLVFVPANRAGSLDAYFWPQIARTDTPAWTLWILRFQVATPMSIADWRSSTVTSSTASQCSSGCRGWREFAS
jgi:hypothetical protein